jgi:hypothetical protein
MNWKLERRLKSTHRVFSCQDDGPNFGRLAIADVSGSRPDNTDDGVLWLDPTRPLRLRPDLLTVPVEGESGGSLWVGVEPPDAAPLSMLEPRFRLALSDRIIEIRDLLEWVTRSGIVSTDERF